MKPTLSKKSTVALTPEQLSAALDMERVVLHLQTGKHYFLDPVGARIWKILGQPQRVEEILRLLLEEFDVDPQACEKDLLELLKDLTEEGLIQVVDPNLS